MCPYVFACAHEKGVDYSIALLYYGALLRSIFLPALSAFARFCEGIAQTFPDFRPGIKHFVRSFNMLLDLSVHTYTKLLHITTHSSRDIERYAIRLLLRK